MLARLSALLGLKPAEERLVFSLIAMLALNTLVLQSVDIVAITNFIDGSGVQKIVLLFALETLITWALAAVYSQIIDRVARVRLIGVVIVMFALMYLGMLVTYASNPEPNPNFYAILYILETQQQNMFPLVFWALVNDLYSASDSGHVFPIIGAGVPIGRILGSLLVAAVTFVFAQRLQNTMAILGISILLLALQGGLLYRAMRGQVVHARISTEAADAKNFFTALVGIDFIRSVPLFFYLALATAAAGFLLTILWYNFFLFGYLEYGDGSLKFQSYYATYNAVFNIVLLLLQLFAVSRLRDKLQLKSAFIPLPLTFALGLGIGVLNPGVAGAAIGLFFAQVVRWAWEKPAIRSVYELVPDERRGRLSIFFDSALFPLGTLLSCLLIQGVLAYNIHAIQTAQFFLRPEIIIAMVIALGAVWAAARLRATYDDSLLNWRLTRSKRQSVLDDIQIR